MSKFIEVKTRYDKLGENGVTKHVTEPYIVDAQLCTEAEAKVTEELRTRISGDFSVEAIKKTKFVSVNPRVGGGTWYKVKIAFATVDERSGTERRSPSEYLIQSLGLKDALADFEKSMHDSGVMNDWVLVAISETSYIDFIPYSPQ